MRGSKKHSIFGRVMGINTIGVIGLTTILRVPSDQINSCLLLWWTCKFHTLIISRLHKARNISIKLNINSNKVCLILPSSPSNKILYFPHQYNISIQIYSCRRIFISGIWHSFRNLEITVTAYRLSYKSASALNFWTLIYMYVLLGYGWKMPSRSRKPKGRFDNKLFE